MSKLKITMELQRRIIHKGENDSSFYTIITSRIVYSIDLKFTNPKSHGHEMTYQQGSK